MTNQIVWCDIPVNDLDRAIKFYSAVLGQTVSKESHGPTTFGLLPHEDGSAGVCLVLADEAKPTKDGPLVYLNCEGHLVQAIAEVTMNGGTILQPKHPIGPYGFRTVLLDSEGNRIALHSK